MTFQRLIAALGAWPLLAAAFVAAHAAPLVKTEHVEAELVAERTAIVPGAPLMQKPDAFGCNLGDYT